MRGGPNGRNFYQHFLVRFSRLHLSTLHWQARLCWRDGSRTRFDWMAVCSAELYRKGSSPKSTRTTQSRILGLDWHWGKKYYKISPNLFALVHQHTERRRDAILLHFQRFSTVVWVHDAAALRLALHIIVVSNMNDGLGVSTGFPIRRDHSAAQWGIWHGRRLNLFASDAAVAGVPRCKIENHNVPKNSVIILPSPKSKTRNLGTWDWICTSDIEQKGLTRSYLQWKSLWIER